MKVIVTGGRGFLGAHVMRLVAEAGHEAISIDRKEGQELLECVSIDGDAIIHCAARADVARNWASRSERERLWSDNVSALTHTLELTRGMRWVFISSLVVRDPESSPYAASKYFGEVLVRMYTERHTIIRPPAMFGSGYTHGHVADFVAFARESGVVHGLTRGDARPAAHVLDVAELCVASLNERRNATHTPVGGTWSWRDTCEMMRVPYTSTEQDRGWPGDIAPHLIEVRPGRPISAGVREALTSLGWP